MIQVWTQHSSVRLDRDINGFYLGMHCCLLFSNWNQSPVNKKKTENRVRSDQPAGFILISWRTSRVKTEAPSHLDDVTTCVQVDFHGSYLPLVMHALSSHAHDLPLLDHALLVMFGFFPPHPLPIHSVTSPQWLSWPIPSAYIWPESAVCVWPHSPLTALCPSFLPSVDLGLPVPTSFSYSRLFVGKSDTIQTQYYGFWRKAVEQKGLLIWAASAFLFS